MTIEKNLTAMYLGVLTLTVTLNTYKSDRILAKQGFYTKNKKKENDIIHNVTQTSYGTFWRIEDI